MPAVSVIIPIFGVEKYIERCARSLFEQTLKDIEYIFVNDCTKDNSINILQNIIKEYPNRQNNISIIHHDINKGLPQARKTGVQYATGEYIAHCDSDDWVDKKMYEEMYIRGVKDNSDVVICHYFSTDGKKNSEGKKKQINSKKDLLQQVMISGNWMLWNKMFKREIYQNNNIIFPHYSNVEDLVICGQLIIHSIKFTILEKPLYYYYTNPNSITRKNSIENIIKLKNEALENIKIFSNFLEKKGILKKYDDEVFNIEFRYKNSIRKFISNKEYYNLWKLQFNSIKLKIIFNRYIYIKTKIRFFIALIFKF